MQFYLRFEIVLQPVAQIPWGLTALQKYISNNKYTDLPNVTLYSIRLTTKVNVLLSNGLGKTVSI